MLLNILDLKKINLKTVRNGVEPKNIFSPNLKNYVDRVAMVMNNIEKDKEKINLYKKVYIR